MCVFRTILNRIRYDDGVISGFRRRVNCVRTSTLKVIKLLLLLLLLSSSSSSSLLLLLLLLLFTAIEFPLGGSSPYPSNK